ncbi:hypothetical protein OQ496_09280 [Acetobacter suratthaniensis]|uniref:Lipoprotein n=1 Tax=Acetobacter suratthaniensis TaxID=1502841 RepID=A0ABS3LMD2_9PROT|nr:hypothetical protein [Acetobacter suratthaniensis]MBO1328521.1 hypothetical protein [Acetobacter suratthaniensis]MCX2566650.1 hypothetical protein [Acetobacter suratthaniensis]
MRALMILCVCLPLCGCTTPVLRPECPTLVSYSAAEQTALAQELAAHTDMPMTHRAMRDYAGLRDQGRACQKAAD